MTKSRDTANIIKQPFTQTLGTSNYRAGVNAGNSITSGGNYNVTVGDEAGTALTTGDQNVAIGFEALKTKTTASNNTAVGYQAAYTSNANYTTAVGRRALYSTTSGISNTAMGDYAGYSTTTGQMNVAMGGETFQDNTTGSYNTALGMLALHSNTTASGNTALGYQAGYTNITGDDQTFIGYKAGRLATGTDNTFVGASSGASMTTGANNTILGKYNGNAGGLDMRTASNHIVLSDGSGNPRGVFDNSGNFLVGNIVNSRATQSGVSVRSAGEVHLNNDATGGGTSLILCYSNHSTADQTKFEVASDGDVFSRTNSFGAFSDERLKEQITDATSQWEDIKAIEVKNYKFISETLSDEENPKFLGVIAQQVELISPSLVDVAEDDIGTKSVKYSILYMKAVKALQEAMTRIETLETKVTALEG